MGPIAPLDSIQLLSRDLRRLRVGEYHRMAEAGIFDEDEAIQLLEGVIVRMSPQTPAHALAVERLSNPQFVGLPAGFVIRCQLPLALSDLDEPEPDIAVLHSETPRSREQHPTTAQLIFEVAVGSLGVDREVKGRLYARAGVPEYVIVNLKDSCLEVHRDPDAAGGGYRTALRHEEHDRFASTSVPGFSFSVAELLA